MEQVKLDYVAMGQQMRLRRKHKKLTQAELATMAGLSLSFLGHIERGSRKASLETILHIATALEVTPNDLMCDSLVVTASADKPLNPSAEVLKEIKRLIDQYIPAAER